MKKYKVAVVELLLKNNKVAQGNDFVNEDELTSSAEELIEKGFIKRPSKSELESLKKEEDNSGVINPPADPATGNGANGSGVVVKTYKQMNKAELQEKLTEREIEFVDTATNADLISLLEADDEENKE